MKTKLVIAALLAISSAKIALAQVAPDADVFVTKAAPATAAASTTITYDVVVGDAGPSIATNVVLSDTLPEEVTFVSITQNSGPTFSCTTPQVGGTGLIQCTIAGLATGEQAAFSIKVTIGAFAPGTTITNVATVKSDADPNEENDAASAATIISGAGGGDVGVMKSGPAGAAPNSDAAYQISVTNTGTSTNVSLTDTLPGTMTFVSLAQNSGPTFNCTTPAVGTGGTISCTIASLAPGSSAAFTLVGHIPSDAASGTEFTNTATVTSDADANAENDSSSTNLTVATADVSIVKSGPASVVAGNTATYTISVANSGPDAALELTVLDTLPAGTTFASLVQNTGPAFSCTTPAVNQTGTVSCTLSSLAPAAPVQFTLTVNVGAVTSINNVASVQTTSSDPNTNNNSSSVATAVTPSADVQVSKTASSTVTAGSNLTYTIVVSNAGPSAAANFSLTDTLPAQTTFVSLGASGTALSCNVLTPGAGGTLSCSSASYPSGGSTTLTLVVRVSPSATGTITNTVNTGSSTFDPNNANQTPMAITTVSTSADLAVTKVAPATAAPGANITYTLSVSNAGPSDASTVSFQDVLPAGTTFVSLTPTSGSFSCSAPAVGSGGSVTCTTPTFAAGASASWTLVVATSPSATGNVTNNASVSSSVTSDPQTANNTVVTSTLLVPTSDLAVTKAGPANATGGQDVTFTITLANGGPSTANSVVMTDALPAGTTFVSFVQNSGAPLSCTTPAGGAAGTITCTAATLPSGGSASFTLVANVAVATFGNVSNTVTVSSATADPNAANNSATAVVVVAPSASIPTMSQMTLMLLALFCGLAGFVALRGR